MNRIRVNAAILFLMFASIQAQAGNPAARVNDPTSHGGLIRTGSSTVHIGGLPAARVDDFASCPQIDPLFPVPIPHVGGNIRVGSGTVLIEGRPAARSGDLIIENNGATSIIGLGSPTVLIGN